MVPEKASHLLVANNRFGCTNIHSELMNAGFALFLEASCNVDVGKIHLNNIDRFITPTVSFAMQLCVFRQTAR